MKSNTTKMHGQQHIKKGQALFNLIWYNKLKHWIELQEGWDWKLTKLKPST